MLMNLFRGIRITLDMNRRQLSQQWLSSGSSGEEAIPRDAELGLDSRRPGNQMGSEPLGVVEGLSTQPCALEASVRRGRGGLGSHHVSR